MTGLDVTQMTETLHKLWPVKLAEIGERYFPNIFKDSKWPRVLTERLMHKHLQ